MLFSAFGTWCAMNTSIIFWYRGEVKKLRLVIELFIAKNGEGAAMVLHSPTDHLGLDALLEEYIEHHHELPDSSWSKLKAICERIKSDITIQQPERLAASNLLAAMVAEFALHKLSRSGYTDHSYKSNEETKK